MPFAKKISSAYISKHKYFTARKDGYETESGKIVPEYFVVEMPNAASALAITADGKVIMIKQFRYPINEICIEIPGGFIDKSESKEDAIARELVEETGYTFSDFYYLGKTYSNPGVLTNYTHLFLAVGGIKTTVQNLDPNEEIEILLFTKEAVLRMIAENEIKQSLHELCIEKGFKKLASLNY